MDCVHAFPSGAYDRLYELPVRVFVSSIAELGEGVYTVGSLVVRTPKIKGTQWVVNGADHEKAGEATVELLEHIAKAGRFEGGKLLACAAAQVGTSGAELVCVRRRGRGADENDLLGPGYADLFEKTRERAGTIAHTMGFAAPRTIGRERHEMRF